MGFLDWLLGKKKVERQNQLLNEPQKLVEVVQPTQTQVVVQEKPKEWTFPRAEARYMSDSEKINLILQGTHAIYDELKPLSEDGSQRVSRLELLLQSMNTTDRETIRRFIEDLDIDDVVVNSLETAMTIEELSAKINRSYGYTAARLRNLKDVGKVARFRDEASGKYKYAKIGDRPPFIPVQPTQEQPPVEQG